MKEEKSMFEEILAGIVVGAVEGVMAVMNGEEYDEDE